MRYARSRRLKGCEDDAYISQARELDLERERPYLRRQVSNKKSGDPSRSVPLAFDERGEFVEPLQGRIPTC